MATPAPRLQIIDLFCGIGSFHHAALAHDMECVFACDIEPNVRRVYEANYGIAPLGDITALDIDADVPDHDILCGGFPCQPFSLIGQRKGTGEDRGRLIDYIAEILEKKQPKACVLENVKGLMSSNGGTDFANILEMIQSKGYHVYHQVLRADAYGIPQMRQRLFLVGLRNDLVDAHDRFAFPAPLPHSPTLAEYMGMPFRKPSANTIRCGGRNSGVDDRRNWDSYRMEDGTVYRLTVADCMKLQGFPGETWDWAEVAESKRLKMLGNTIPTCLSKTVLGAVKAALTPRPAPPSPPRRARPPRAPRPAPGLEVQLERLALE